MKFIATKSNFDGSFDECGMNNRTLFSKYKSKTSFNRYCLPFLWPDSDAIRVECFYDDRFYGDPVEVYYRR